MKKKTWIGIAVFSTLVLAGAIGLVTKDKEDKEQNTLELNKEYSITSQDDTTLELYKETYIVPPEDDADIKYGYY